MNKQFVIFTDLDGTLLDHETYNHEPAAKMLEKLRKAKIPVIPTTSKTYSELTVLRKEIGLTGPFIIENGAAVHIPHGFFRQKPANTQWLNDHWVRQFTSRKQYWINLLQKVGSNYPEQFTHFAAMSIEEICASTGLTPEAAARAAQRQYGEPVLWLGNNTQKARFLTELRLKGARPLQGGRFVHVSGECDKGSALQWVIKELERQNPSTEFISIALGDGENDIAMLEHADIAARILSPGHSLPELNKIDNVIDSSLTGPSGWSETLEQILRNYI